MSPELQRRKILRLVERAREYLDAEWRPDGEAINAQINDVLNALYELDAKAKRP